MKNKFVKIFMFILIFNMFFLSGCWDSRELDKLFIVGSSAIDLAEDDKYEFTMQLVKTKPASSNNTEQQSGSINSFVLSAKNKSIIDAYMTMNENCSRGLLFDHNEVTLFGETLAQNGIEDVLDVFIRVQEARIEIPLVVVEGENGSSVLKAKIDENALSGKFVTEVVEGLSMVSKSYKMRIIDVMKNLLCESHATTLPMIKLIKKDNKDVIEFAGFALLKDGKMVGKLDQEQTKGFVFGNENVKTLIFHTETEEGLVGYRADSIEGKVNVNLTDNNQIEVNVDVKGNVEIDEIVGFYEIEQKELVAKLKEYAQQKVKQLIEQTILITQNVNCDVYGIANKIWKKYPKFWREIEDNWDNLYPQLVFKVNTNFEIPIFGDIIQSISIEKSIHERENNISGN